MERVMRVKEEVEEEKGGDNERERERKCKDLRQNVFV